MRHRVLIREVKLALGGACVKSARWVRGGGRGGWGDAPIGGAFCWEAFCSSTCSGRYLPLLERHLRWLHITALELLAMTVGALTLLSGAATTPGRIELNLQCLGMCNMRSPAVDTR